VVRAALASQLRARYPARFDPRPGKPPRSARALI